MARVGGDGRRLRDAWLGDRGLNADVALARAAIGVGNRAKGIELLQRALDLARQLDDPELLCSCAWQLMWNGSTPQHWQRSSGLAQEFADWPRERVRSRTVGQMLEFCGAGLLAHGDRARADSVWRELSDLAARTRDAFIEINAMGHEGMGRCSTVVWKRPRRSLAHDGPRPPTGHGALAAYWAWARCGRALIYLGRAGEAQILGQAAGQTSDDAFMLAHVGRFAESRRAVHAWLARHKDAIQTAPVEHVWILTTLLEAAVLVEDEDSAAVLAPCLADLSGTVSWGHTTCIALHLGAAAMLVGDWLNAQVWCQQALEVTTRVRFRPEIPLSRLQIAELLLVQARLSPPRPKRASGGGATHGTIWTLRSRNSAQCTCSPRLNVPSASAAMRRAERVRGDA